MKRLIKILSIVLFFGLVLAGCSNTAKSSSNAGFVGKSFSGKTPVEDATNGKMTIHFVDNKRAVVIESGKFEVGHEWGRLVFDVKYKKMSGNKVKLTYLKGINESYASEKDMNNHATPVFMHQDKVDKDSNMGGYVYVDENYVSFSKVSKKDGLFLTDKKDASSYDSYLKKTTEKYYGKDTKLSDRGFMSPATELVSNGIAFKGSRFIWTYGGPDSKFANETEQGARLASFMGNYKLQGNKLILYLQYHSNVYQGTVSQLNNMQFQSKLTGSDIPKKLVFEFTKNNKLHLITKFKDYKSDDMLDYGTVDGTPNYAKMSKNNQPNVYTVGMEKTEDSGAKEEASKTDANNETDESLSSASVTDTFPTKEDFAQWVSSYFTDQGSEATDDTPGFHVTGSGSGETVQVRDMDNNQSAVPVVYSLAYSYTALNDDSAIEPAQTIAIDSDGNIYSGHFIMLDNDLTQAYSDYVNNN
ncbi:hypothetical protein [Companilactobacillus jidongensis]|uniref:hypothetical protein n=1 Tax=Companilactobacillus jidongensis TaxID=2486006 RepID=UPI000F77B437|nr:hypothetical protein [Companilactobacillus jidongensis]